ncbi:LPS export ABC transporter ATP-binding protein [Holospora curviuscula]|uniref:Lipopolysaccharide export system ATP-binding protein LptB n=1 Tax=Holospora curviuscula TaxID=1082868 RepID=A0A2S5RE47_9PROT|nr:LPS export ABC transporter ATP-binding protein [Holospora curviuscula]PPE05593.1 Lipopolysaccharide export system ATP-binding protein LptB [Holospora curviuscula]
MDFFAHNLWYSFRKKHIVQEVSLRVSSGESVALLGPNGAGKTSTFLLMSGLILPSKGSIFLNEKNVTLWPLYRKARLGIRYLPQESSIFRDLTVENNLKIILERMYLSIKDQKFHLEQLLNDFHLNAQRKYVGGVLSGGERRRLEIARALIGEPKFLLLDEPFAGIDPRSIEDVQGLIRGLKQRNIGILITDHNVRETLSLVDRVYIMFEGRVLKEGTPEAVLQSDKVRSVYLGDTFSL